MFATSNINFKNSLKKSKRKRQHKMGKRHEKSFSQRAIRNEYNIHEKMLNRVSIQEMQIQTETCTLAKME